MIIIEPCAGLGNKLLGMSSAYAVAQKLNRERIVMWKREVGCNVKAEELFDLPFRVIEISENGYSKEPVAHFRGNQLKKKCADAVRLYVIMKSTLLFLSAYFQCLFIKLSY